MMLIKMDKLLWNSLQLIFKKWNQNMIFKLRMFNRYLDFLIKIKMERLKLVN
jgi:hypothetical protein